jgi:hypothetical protein
MAFNRIKLNFVWAMVYNVVLIPIAMGILYPFSGLRLPPALAGLAMAFSSISVVGSSLLLRLFSPMKSKHEMKVQEYQKEYGPETSLINSILVHGS